MSNLRQQVEAEARKIVRNDNLYICDFDGGGNPYERVDVSWLESAIADILESYAKRCEDLEKENSELRKKGAE